MVILPKHTPKTKNRIDSDGHYFPLTFRHMGWILSYPPMMALHQVAFWTVPMEKVSVWCIGCTKPIHTKPQNGSISRHHLLPVDGSAISVITSHVEYWLIVNIHQVRLWKLNWVLLRCYALSLKGNPVNRTVWGSEGLPWRETTPAFHCHWTWTSQIQMTPSHKTPRKKSLSCRQRQIHCFYQNKPARQESANWVFMLIVTYKNN